MDMPSPKSSIRVGTGAGFSDDRIEPAVELALRGKLDYLVFECLAERTIARVTVSLAQDMHGKSLSSLMLTIDLHGGG